MAYQRKKPKKKKNDYQKFISEYLKRRDNFRKLNLPIEEYFEKTKTITAKIGIWRCALSRIKKRETFLTKLIEYVEDFFGEKPSNDHTLATDMYFRYGLEHGCGGGHMRRCLKLNTEKSYPARARLKIIRSSIKNYKYKEFCNFVYLSEGKTLELQPINKRKSGQQQLRQAV